MTHAGLTVRNRFMKNLPIWCLCVIHQSSAFLSNRREKYFCWHSRPRQWRRRVLVRLLCAEQSPKRAVKWFRLTEIITIMYCIVTKWMLTSCFTFSTVEVISFKEQIFSPSYKENRAIQWNLLFRLNWFQIKPCMPILKWQVIKYIPLPYYSVHNSPF